MREGIIETLEWDNYIKGIINQTECLRCKEAFCTSLTEQRKLIGMLLHKLKPINFACMGSGYLNDIPIDILFDNEKECYLIDWIANISEEGVKGSIINLEGGNYSCLFCEHARPEHYCHGFKHPLEEGNRVCQGFHLVEIPTVHCENYIPGEEPHFITFDVTQGRSTDFAKRMFKLIQTSNTPVQAFRKAISVCQNGYKVKETLSITDDYFDLITSSMVVSQFDVEPYRYFSKLLESKFGREQIMQNEELLLPLMEKLRSELFRVQMEGHALEMFRLVNKQHGRICFSVELFCSLPGRKDFFLVHEITRSMEILSKYFNFDFHLISPEDSLKSTKMGNETSIIQCYALIPKTDIAF